MKNLTRLALAATLSLGVMACGSEPEEKKTPVTCTASCEGATCGQSDGCGGKCAGTCSSGQLCNQTTLVCEAEQSSCAMPATLPTGPMTVGLAYTGDPSMDEPDLSASIALDDSPVFDSLLIDLYDGYGVFTDGIAPGTYEIAGDELDIDSCGLCIQVNTDIDDNVVTGPVFFATGGTVTITSIAGNFTASLSNLTFHEVNDNMEPVGSCTSSLADASFDFVIDK